MGSFNITCGLSDLPITSGDEVYGFFLLSNVSDADTNDPEMLYKPIPLSVKCTYVDRGIFKTSDKAILPIVEFFNDHIYDSDDTMVVENSDNLNIKKGDVTPENVFELVRNEVLVLDIRNVFSNSNRYVAFMPVHKHIFEGIVNNPCIVRQPMLDENRKLYYMDLNRHNYIDYLRHNTNPNDVLFYKLSNKLSDDVEIPDTEYLKSSLRRVSSSSSYDILHECEESIVCESLLEYCLFNMFMHNAECVYKPGLYSSETCDSLMYHDQLLELKAEQIRLLKNRFEE